MRLDHLLSKEQHIHAPGIPGSELWSGQGLNTECVFALVAQGIVELLDICHAGFCRGVQVLIGFPVVERVISGLVVVVFIGTLLGPEATRRGAGHSPGNVVSGVVFENCRVDASIFVVKLLRAHGGCLGFRSR